MLYKLNRESRVQKGSDQMEVIIKVTAKEIADLVRAIQDRQNDWLSNVQLDTNRVFSEFVYRHTPESQQQQQPQQPE